MSPNNFRPDLAGETLDLDKLQLVALPQSVRLSRRLVQAQLPQWGLSHLVDQVTLAVSEYATNAVRATGPDQAPNGYAALHDETPAMFAVRLRRTATHLIVEVSDTAAAPPVPRSATADDEAGRGRSRRLVRHRHRQGRVGGMATQRNVRPGSASGSQRVIRPSHGRDPRQGLTA
ncbi:ATP-binding protein [Actinocorallia sp. API 0066]|uniref:ATP-binding protein n=1 Tax=Actinocorallia sp. API 0066 TaxID=2896846 RepID=UPI001E63AF2E|nr:ATP-binding protein [Actinocorallia sp. API 0066]MCD0448320.1 ATP-binding protein [Actinocorallia sp. API 0066]